MAAERGRPIALHNETAINVAGLLKEPTGSTRHFALTLDRLPLDEGLTALVLAGEVRLTRPGTGERQGRDGMRAVFALLPATVCGRLRRGVSADR
jgi:hypothetical protein